MYVFCVSKWEYNGGFGMMMISSKYAERGEGASHSFKTWVNYLLLIEQTLETLQPVHVASMSGGDR